MRGVSCDPKMNSGWTIKTTPVKDKMTNIKLTVLIAFYLPYDILDMQKPR